MKRALLLSGASLLLGAAATLLTGHYFPPTPRVGVLDLAGLYRLKEAQISRLLSAEGASPASREQALQEAGEFGDRLEALLSELPGRCGCLVLARSAVLGSPGVALDLTADVRTRLGL